MSLRQSLKEDFGLEVLVEGGSGLRDDPFVIERCSAADATRTQLNLLRGLGRGRRELWRLLQMEPVVPAVQRLRIKSVLFTEGRVDGVPDAGIPLIEWTHPRTTFSAISQIGWVHFDCAIDNSHDPDMLDTTLQYSSIGTNATIYAYDASDQSLREPPHAARRARELEVVCAQIRKNHPYRGAVAGLYGGTLCVAGISCRSELDHCWGCSAGTVVS